MTGSNGNSSLADRAAIKVLHRISGTLWDLKANLMVDAVDQHGPGSTVAWFASNMPTYEKILKTWGPLRTHYLAVVISAVNGCGYCTYGHAYAFCLHYFDRFDTLFPLDEIQLMGLADTTDPDDAVDRFTQALRTGDLADEVTWVDQTMSVSDLTRPLNRDEKWMLHLVEMFAWLNACGIKGDTEPDGAHDPVNKNTELQDRYAKACAARAS